MKRDAFTLPLWLSDERSSDPLAGAQRIVCWFSCGAASAVATKIAIAVNRSRVPLVVARCAIDEEHPDNDRFASDCQRWFGAPILALESEKFGRSIFNVFIRERYIAGAAGAPCTRALKKRVREAFQRPGDLHVLGYTVEEAHRVDSFIDANNDVRLWPVLVDRKLSHADCLGLVQRAGIDLPVMYSLGYQHNNCIGCVKGGKGYWNKIRRDFPDTFARMAAMEREIGRSCINGQFLDELDPSVGRYSDEPDMDCSLLCATVSDEFAEKGQ